ncbi:MAG: hypothetical protein CM1200mP39_23150 [Dehalococcoidia bacterium]|nr:MAG: hypothetical protein CM1200mP39_23150 [Dehalococcoidia bacterium]
MATTGQGVNDAIADTVEGPIPPRVDKPIGPEDCTSK